MYCLSNLCVHIVAIQVPKQSVRNHHNLWKLRGAHSDQGICWNIAPLNFQRNDAKTHSCFFLPPLIIFGKKSAPLKYWKHFYCPPEFCPAFWKPPLKLNGDLKPLLVRPWFCFAFSKPPLKLKSKISAPLNHAEQKHMSNPLKKAIFNRLIKGGPAPQKCYARV